MHNLVPHFISIISILAKEHLKTTLLKTRNLAKKPFKTFEAQNHAHFGVQDPDNFVERDLVVSRVRRPEKEDRNGGDVSSARGLEVAQLAEGVAVAGLRRLA